MVRPVGSKVPSGGFRPGTVKKPEFRPSCGAKKAALSRWHGARRRRVGRKAPWPHRASRGAPISLRSNWVPRCQALRILYYVSGLAFARSRENALAIAVNSADIITLADSVVQALPRLSSSLSSAPLRLPLAKTAARAFYKDHTHLQPFNFKMPFKYKSTAEKLKAHSFQKARKNNIGRKFFQAWRELTDYHHQRPRPQVEEVSSEVITNSSWESPKTWSKRSFKKSKQSWRRRKNRN